MVVTQTERATKCSFIGSALGSLGSLPDMLFDDSFCESGVGVYGEDGVRIRCCQSWAQWHRLIILAMAKAETAGSKFLGLFELQNEFKTSLDNLIKA